MIHKDEYKDHKAILISDKLDLKSVRMDKETINQEIIVTVNIHMPYGDLPNFNKQTIISTKW